LLGACGIFPLMGSGRLVTKSPAVSGFDRIELSGIGDAVIVQDGTESVTVETDDNLMPYVEAEVRGSTLFLGLKTNSFQAVQPTRLHFTVHVKDLSGLDVSGAGTVTTAALKTSNLTVTVSGSGTLRVDSLIVDELSATVSGAGDLTLAGKAASQTVYISGSGTVKTGDLHSQTAQVDISGAGDATLWVDASLDVTVSGSGEVNYYGVPQLSLLKSGAGSVRSLGAK
jgi:hypothetical protein